MRGRLFLLNQSQVPAAKSFPLAAGVYSVGRSSQCDLVVPHVTISRRHAEIRVAGGSVTIVDLESRNGTFVNNVRIRTCTVEEGQSVRFGRVPFMLASSLEALEQLDSEQETMDQRDAPPQTPIPKWIVEMLSRAQVGVLLHLVRGLSEKEIARKLEISQHTVHHHIRDIYRILNVHSRGELLALIMKE
jgi:pSer/pThr/pTyr-binding forkhead associated (FHA) protein